MTVRQLADAAGVAFSTVHRIEAGLVVPHVSTRTLLASALGVPTAVVFPAHSSDYHTPDGAQGSNDSRPGGSHANGTPGSDLTGV